MHYNSTLAYFSSIQEAETALFF